MVQLYGQANVEMIKPRALADVAQALQVST